MFYDGGHMMIKRVTIFIILLSVTFFAFSLSFKSHAMYDIPEIRIYISKASNSNIDYEDIHVELMVLKSDFNEIYINSTINESYMAYYPNYLNYTHLEDDTEISYFAYIDQSSISRYNDEISYSDTHWEIGSITYLRLIMFTSDGTILARSELYKHTDRYDSGARDIYYANFDNHTFRQTVQDSITQSLIKLFLLSVLIFGVIFIGTVFLIRGLKTRFSVLLKVEYKDLSKTRKIDVSFLFFGYALSAYFYIIVFNQAVVNSILVATLIFLIWNAINYFTLVKKESRKKYLIVGIILYLIFSIIIFISLKILS
jgi:hypothetical protein